MKKLLLIVTLLWPIIAVAQTLGPLGGGCSGACAFSTVAVGGATIGSNALAVTGASNFTGDIRFGTDNTYWIGGNSSLNTSGASPQKIFVNNEILIAPSSTPDKAQGVINGQAGYLLLKAENAQSNSAGWWPGIQIISSNGSDHGALYFAYGGGFGSKASDSGSQVFFQNVSGGSATNTIQIDGSHNIVLGSGAIATSSSSGFLYAVSGAGTPTGTPTGYTGRVPIYIDTTNSQLWLYMGGAWKQPKTPAGAAVVTWQ